MVSWHVRRQPSIAMPRAVDSGPHEEADAIRVLVNGGGAIMKRGQAACGAARASFERRLRE